MDFSYSGLTVYIVNKNENMQIFIFEATNILLGISVNLVWKSLQ